MVYDAATSSIVLFGGQTEAAASPECAYTLSPGAGEKFCNDTWTWNGVDWTEQSPATRPGARTQGSFAYDSTHGTVVLFGGCAYGSCAAPDNRQPGCWRMMEAGKRYLAGTWPAGDVDAQRNPSADPCNAQGREFT